MHRGIKFSRTAKANQHRYSAARQTDRRTVRQTDRWTDKHKVTWHTNPSGLSARDPLGKQELIMRQYKNILNNMQAPEAWGPLHD